MTDTLTVDGITFFRANGDTDALRFNNKMNGAENTARYYAKWTPEQIEQYNLVENGRKYYDRQKALIPLWDGIYARGVAQATSDIASLQADYDRRVHAIGAKEAYRAAQNAKIAALQAEIDGADAVEQARQKSRYDLAVSDKEWILNNKETILSWGVTEDEYNNDWLADCERLMDKYSDYATATAPASYVNQRQRKIDDIQKDLNKSHNQPLPADFADDALDRLNTAIAEYADVMDGADDVEGENPDEEMKAYFMRLEKAWQVSLPGLFA